MDQQLFPVKTSHKKTQRSTAIVAITEVQVGLSFYVQSVSVPQMWLLRSIILLSNRSNRIQPKLKTSLMSHDVECHVSSGESTYSRDGITSGEQTFPQNDHNSIAMVMQRCIWWWHNLKICLGEELFVIADYRKRVVPNTWLLFEEFRMSLRAKHIRTLLLNPFFTHNISLTSREAVPERTLRTKIQHFQNCHTCNTLLRKWNSSTI